MGCLDDKKPSDPYTASLTDDGRYRLLVEAVTDYAIYMLDINGTADKILVFIPGRQFEGVARAEIDD